MFFWSIHGCILLSRHRAWNFEVIHTCTLSFGLVNNIKIIFLSFTSVSSHNKCVGALHAFRSWCWRTFQSFCWRHCSRSLCLSNKANHHFICLLAFWLFSLVKWRYYSNSCNLVMTANLGCQVTYTQNQLKPKHLGPAVEDFLDWVIWDVTSLNTDYMRSGDPP